MNVELRRIFEARVKERMRELDWNQSRVAAELGVQRAIVSHWLTGKKNVTFETVERFATALGVSPSELLSTENRAVHA